MNVRFLLVAALLAVPAASWAQVATVESDEDVEAPPAADDARGAARDAQARFERIRMRYARLSFGGGSGNCDEYVGRFCTSYDEGEWYPREQADEVLEARASLLSRLDSLQPSAPGDGWILGQRVWYRADGGDWEGALAVAMHCGSVEAWWCSALQGLALHGLGRYDASLLSFESALSDMDPRVANEWRMPERAVDRDARRVLHEAEEAGPDSLASVLSTLWLLADPLFLVGGNDRLTAHYARWTVSTLKEDARNPYGMAWADDLEELTVRHGWEVGWERTRNTLSAARDGAVGHKHPEGRDYLPPGRALREPAAADPPALAAARRDPRSLYAPRYAPVLLPMEGVVAVFPRRERSVVVATAFLPEDTTFHAEHDHPRPWMDPGDQTGSPDRLGVFAVPVGGGEAASSVDSGRAEGSLMLEVPAGDYVLSVESWSPERRRAGRSRSGLTVRPPAEDVATLSDILLLKGGEAEPVSLDEALPLVRTRTRVGPEDALAIGWELSGLGFRPETLEYALSVERTDRGVLRRIGQFFGLADRPRPLALVWQESAPEEPGHRFRYLDLDLPPLDPGRYEITLTLRSAGRSDVQAVRPFEVVEH